MPDNPDAWIGVSHLASTGLQALRGVHLAVVALAAALVLTVVVCLLLIRLLRGKVFRAWWVWLVSPAFCFCLFFLAWLVADLLM